MSEAVWYTGDALTDISQEEKCFAAATVEGTHCKHWWYEIGPCCWCGNDTGPATG